MKSYLIRNRDELAEWFSRIHIMKPDIYPLTLEVYKGEKRHRSLPQNNISHVWYREIAQQAGDRTPEEVRRECKLSCGVPILRTESDEFRAMYDKVVKGHDYETKLLMMDYLPVTSLMSSEQMTEYLETVYYKYSQAGYFIARQ